MSVIVFPHLFSTYRLHFALCVVLLAFFYTINVAGIATDCLKISPPQVEINMSLKWKRGLCLISVYTPYLERDIIIETN
jgi:hypothetical protein